MINIHLLRDCREREKELRKVPRGILAFLLRPNQHGHSNHLMKQ